MPALVGLVLAVAVLHATAAAGQEAVGVSAQGGVTPETADGRVGMTVMASPNTITPATCSHALVVTLSLDATSPPSLVCNMFREIAEGIVWGLAALGVHAEEACCQPMATECWSFLRQRTVPYTPVGHQVR